jgi:hypothetical protein
MVRLLFIVEADEEKESSQASAATREICDGSDFIAAVLQ